MEGLTETFENLVLAVITMTPAVDNDTRGWIMSIVSGIGKSFSSLSVSADCPPPSRVQSVDKALFSANPRLQLVPLVRVLSASTSWSACYLASGIFAYKTVMCFLLAR